MKRKLTPRNKVALLLLAVMLLVFGGSSLRSKLMIYLGIFLLAAALFYVSWLIGVKGHYELLSVNLGEAFGKLAAILLFLIGLGFVVWFSYAIYTKIPMHFK